MFIRSLLFLLSLLVLTSTYHNRLEEHSFLIHDESQLSIDGSSNVNQFSCLCLCYEKNRAHTFQLEEGGAKGTAYFDGTVLKLRTERLDCGHKGINGDLYNTLEADAHPYIEIELLQARQQGGVSLVSTGRLVPLEALTAITIAGVTRRITMDVQGRRLGSDRYHFTATHDLFMSDFQLVPPRPLFGLVKVDDRIQINFDLIVEVKEAPAG